MRKILALIFVIISTSLFIVSTSFGKDNCTIRISPSHDYDGIMLTRLYSLDSDFPKPYLEMLIIDSKGRKTGNDLTRSYNEIPLSGYKLDSGVEDKKFYELDMVVVEGEIYTLQVIGRQNGSYYLTISVDRYRGDRASIVEEFNDVKIKKSEAHKYTLKFSNTAPMEIKRIN
jgi:hypothetical protein